ncbi:MAG: nuclear transport factor 2 family protein [Gammaproteobacteria bacterium]|nr:nuclear transport factor 2 family protein [Gammaproteobacteria bacterium]
MCTYKRVVSGILVSLLLFAAASGAWAAKGSSKELAALQAVDQEWVKAYNAGDVGTVASLYAEDAVLLPPGVSAVHGRVAIHAFFVGDTAASRKAGVEFHLTGHPDGGVNGDWGWCSGTYNVTDKAGHIVEMGKYLSVSRMVSGKWRYVRDTWNSDGPVSTTPST